MASLITDLLESERLAARHAALHREPVVLPEPAREVMAELKGQYSDAAPVLLDAAAGLLTLSLDSTRMRMLLRNLLDNALCHGAGAAQPTELCLQPDGAGIRITACDSGRCVPEAQSTHLAEPFFHPDSARVRPQGGVLDSWRIAELHLFIAGNSRKAGLSCRAPSLPEARLSCLLPSGTNSVSVLQIDWNGSWTRAPSVWCPCGPTR
jgi:light-regulated signal transduction histidine kinase (bacteriophytochrome)